MDHRNCGMDRSVDHGKALFFQKEGAHTDREAFARMGRVRRPERSVREVAVQAPPDQAGRRRFTLYSRMSVSAGIRNCLCNVRIMLRLNFRFPLKISLRR